MDILLETQHELQATAKRLLTVSPLLELLSGLGKPTQRGSSVTGLMVYPDIDLTIQHENPDVQSAIDIVPMLYQQLQATKIHLADFRDNPTEHASYYLGIALPFDGKSWSIDATITTIGPIVSDPPELDEWIASMTYQQKLIILQLKYELIQTRRYVGARSQPPYTFRSIHLYEGVLKGNAQSIDALERYFKQ